MKHIVKLSALGAENPDKFWWAGEHTKTEAALKELGLALTSIRPSGFYSNFINMSAPTIKQQRKIFQAMADAKANFIYNGDIAAASVVALTTPGHENKDYYITGPDTLSYPQVADLFSQVLGEKIEYVPIDDATLRENAKKRFPNQEAVEGYSNMWQYFRDGYYDVHYRDLESLTGSKGKPLKDWIQENVAAFK